MLGRLREVDDGPRGYNAHNVDRYVVGVSRKTIYRHLDPPPAVRVIAPVIATRAGAPGR